MAEKLAVRQPPFGRADSPGAPTGWAILPGPQSAAAAARASYR